MTEDTTEFRLKRGSSILGYISRFSATEKAVFWLLVIAATISALLMAVQANNLFMREIPARGGELREAELGLPRTINPVLAVSDTDRDISALVYAGLTKYDGGTIVPDIAQSWTVSTDGLTYDFVLKPGTTFQDGTPLTTNDIAFTIEKMQDPVLKSPHQADWANVTVKVVSPSEIQFTLKQAYSGFLSNTTIGIMPEHIWSTVSDDQFIFSEYNIKPVGAGPYKVSSIVRDSGGIPTSYNVVPWNGYKGDAPHIGTISFRFYTSEAKALTDLNAGILDSIPSVDPAAATELASNSAQSYTVLSTPLPRVFGVFMNQNQASVLAEDDVRQALDMATDRSAVINTVLYGYGTPIHGPVPPSILENLGISTAPATDTADIAGAQALLEKNGWVKGSDGIYAKKPAKGKTASTVLAFDIYTLDSPDLVAAANLLKAQWATLGADVGVQVFDQADLYQNVIRTRKYDALLFGEQIGKDLDMYAFWHSSERNSPGLNVALYTNSKVDALLSAIRGDASTTDLAAHYSQLENIIQGDTPAIFLYSPDFIYAVPKSLKGITLGQIVMPSDRWSSIDSWYTETEKVWNIFHE